MMSDTKGFLALFNAEGKVQFVAVDADTTVEAWTEFLHTRSAEFNDNNVSLYTDEGWCTGFVHVTRIETE